MNKISPHLIRDSYFNKIRRKRFNFFLKLLKGVKRPIKILDVGGSEQFWQMMDFDVEGIEITILNLIKVPVKNKHFKSIAGDGRDMKMIMDKYYDIVFSNSVIEHLGTRESQIKMAREIKRVAKRYFVQTPNKYFPIEPHFIFPFFQLLPLGLKIWLCTNFSLGHIGKLKKPEAIETIKSMKMVSGRELAGLFRRSKIYKEKYFGLIKSFIAYGGFE